MRTVGLLSKFDNNLYHLIDTFSLIRHFVDKILDHFLVFFIHASYIFIYLFLFSGLY